MDWNTFVTTLMATGFASAAFVFLAKILSKHLLSMDLERFKAELKATNEKELERLRADLRIAAFQQETTFAKLHEKRADIITELYSRLVKFDSKLDIMTNPFFQDSSSDSLGREQAAIEAGKDLTHYFTINQIYFDESLCNSIRQLLRTMTIAHLTHIDCQVSTQQSTDAWNLLRKEVPPIKNEIERNFRQLLGLTVQKLKHEGTLPKQQ